VRGRVTKPTVFVCERTLPYHHFGAVLKPVVKANITFRALFQASLSVRLELFIEVVCFHSYVLYDGSLFSGDPVGVHFC